MSGESKFRRNILLVAAIHALALAGLFFATGGAKKTVETPTWLDGGSPPAGASGEEAAVKQEEPTPEPTPKPSQEKVAPPPPAPTEAASEIVLPTPSPSAIPSPTATPTATPEPTPSPTPKPT
ncbi:MAG: hypothetical protein WCO68_11105, partial [Verrucomicrobiota bacterium]